MIYCNFVLQTLMIYNIDIIFWSLTQNTDFIINTAIYYIFSYLGFGWSRAGHSAEFRWGLRNEVMDPYFTHYYKSSSCYFHNRLFSYLHYLYSVHHIQLLF